MCDRCCMQVRDMTGTGEITKRRLKEGDGEFPIDCPLNDTTIRVHYRVRRLDLCQPLKADSRGPQGASNEWVYDTRQPQAVPDSAVSASGEAADLAAAPVEIDTGCGEAPEAIEMCAKLMVPGELALVRVTNPR